MAKNFKKSLGSKTLSSLIPTTQEEEVKETAPPVVIPVVKKTVKEVTSPPVQIERKVVETIKEQPPVQKEAPIAKNVTKKAAKPKEVTTTVTTFRVNDDNLRAMKAIAFWDRKKIQEVFNEALTNYIDQIPKATLKKAIAEYERRYGKE